MSSFWPKYIMLELKKYRGVMFDSTEYWWKIWKKNWLALSKLTWGNCHVEIGNHRLKNSDFIVESKMEELNQNKNSKQTDRPDAVWNFYFTMEINE